MDRHVRNNESERNSSNVRVMNSPLLSFSIKNEVRVLKKGSGWAHGKRSAVTLRENDDLKVVLMSVHKGAALKDHRADGPITIYVVSGEMIFTTEEETIKAGSGNLIVLEAPLVHHIEAVEETHIILTMVHPK